MSKITRRQRSTASSWSARRPGPGCAPEAERGVEVLAHQGVLELGSLGEQVGQLLAALHDDGRLSHHGRKVSPDPRPVRGHALREGTGQARGHNLLRPTDQPLRSTPWIPASAHGSWPTPITSELVVRAAARLGEVVVDGDDVWWSESRPAEGGRSVIVRRSADGAVTDVLPAPWNARTRVHEYGGGAWTVSGGTLWFTEFADQRLYRLDAGSDTPVAGDAGAGRAGRRPARRPARRSTATALLAVRETHAEGDRARRRRQRDRPGGPRRQRRGRWSPAPTSSPTPGWRPTA